MKTSHIKAFLEEIIRLHGVGIRTIQHTKHLLSGVFQSAIDKDLVDRNPVRPASLPPARRPGETVAYSAAVVDTMLRLLTDLMTSTVVAVAAWAGLRCGEIRGLDWLDYEPGDLGLLRVCHSVWRKHTTEPKTEAAMGETDPCNCDHSRERKFSN